MSEKSDDFEKSIKDKLKQKRRDTRIDYNILLKKFFIDSFLVNLSKSKYATSFVWKGGFVLSAITGIEKRTTVDLDTMLNGIDLNENTLRDIIENIIDSNQYCSIGYKLVNIEPIQEEKDYAGLRVKIAASMSNVRDSFHIDIATGEELDSSVLEFKYKPMLEDEAINIFIYSPERILAEKLQTLLARGLANTRMKDFYDIYVLPQTQEISIDKLSKEFKSIMYARNTIDTWTDYKFLLDNMLLSGRMKRAWKNYGNRNEFTRGISFEKTINSADNLLEKISKNIEL